MDVAAAAPFRALADPTRRAILDLLREGERAVVELLSHFEMSQPALSKHLRILREAGLVSPRRDGRKRMYRLEPLALKAVYDWVAHYEAFWNERLDALGGVLDSLDDAGGSS